MTPEQEFANMILAMTPKEFDAWADKMSIEEIARVTYTISLANQQLREQMECLQEEEDYYIEEELEYGNLFDAQEVLSKYTLKGIQ